MDKRTMSKLGKLAALLGLLLVTALAQHQASASTSPCPSGCGYKYDPATRCCVPDPRFDCVELCF